MRPRGAQALHQRGEVRVAADLAVAPRQPLEVEVREGVRPSAAWLNAKRLQECRSDDVRRPARSLAEAEIYARFAEMDRQELRVHVGDVQQAGVAEGRGFVELVGGLRLREPGPQRGAGRSGARERSEEHTS